MVLCLRWFAVLRLSSRITQRVGLVGGRPLVPLQPDRASPSRNSDGAGHTDASNDAHRNPDSAHLAPNMRHLKPPFLLIRRLG